MYVWDAFGKQCVFKKYHVLYVKTSEVNIKNFLCYVVFLKKTYIHLLMLLLLLLFLTDVVSEVPGGQ